MNILSPAKAKAEVIREAKNTAAVEAICAEITAVCDRAYGGLDFGELHARAVAHGMEESYKDGPITVLRMSAALEQLYEYFVPRTDWAALGEILGRAKVPFTVRERISTDRYLDRKTGLFTLTASGLTHSGDFSFGTVGGVAIGTVTGDLENLASDIHPTQQIVEAARAFMDDRWARRDEERSAFYAKTAHGFSGGSAGKDRLPIIG